MIMPDCTCGPNGRANPGHERRCLAREEFDRLESDLRDLRVAVQKMLGPDTYDVVKRRAENRLLRERDLVALRRAYTEVPGVFS